jgi:hypothetical protein
MNGYSCCGIAIMLAGAAQAQLMYGTIVDAVSRKPIPNATITILEISKTCTTDSAGHYSTGIVPSGIFNATISAPNYLNSFKKVFIAWPKGRGLSEIKFNTGLFHVGSGADTSKGKMSLKYRFSGHGDVEISIKNGIGKVIRKMYDRSRIGGMRTVFWDGKNDKGETVPAGRYMCKISSGRLVIIRSLEWNGVPDVPSSPPAPAEETDVPPQENETTAPPPAVPEFDATTTLE